MANKLNQDQQAQVFHAFKKWMNAFVIKHNITPATLRNWCLKESYPRDAKIWNKVNINKVRNLFKKGLTPDEIGAKLNLSKMDVHQIMYGWGLRVKDQPVEKYNAVKKLLAQNKYSMIDIAKMVGVHYQYVYNFARIEKRIEDDKKFMQNLGHVVERLNKGMNLTSICAELDLTYSRVNKFIFAYTTKGYDGIYQLNEDYNERVLQLQKQK